MTEPLKYPSGEEASYFPPAEPDPMILLSIQMGTDLTPHGDLEQRLTIAVDGCSKLREDLAALRTLVDGYAKTVQSLDLEQIDGPQSEVTVSECSVHPDASPVPPLPG